MRTREELERRVADLERQLASVSSGRAQRGVRARARWQLAGLPFYDIAFGPDPSRGEARGHARGFIAMGDIATGVIAAGGLARGLIAAGGCAVGLLTFGGLSVGALAFGGLAVGGVAFGGGAIGGVAIGGGAAGYYACGGGAVGEYVVAPYRIDPEAQRFFSEYFPAAGSCSTRVRYRTRNY